MKRGRFNPPSESKYKNKPVFIDGKRMHSTLEAARYLQLRDMERDGVIRELDRQQAFRLIDSTGGKICNYVSDFTYKEGLESIVEDVKGKTLEPFKMKAALFEMQYGFCIRIIKAQHVPQTYRDLATDIRKMQESGAIADYDTREQRGVISNKLQPVVSNKPHLETKWKHAVR